ncbi:MAG: hypothetical protein CL573_01545 [Alphaproteobacteria bacterium]|nr:hypothetical protein [Alphaproteobacteria bacterium]HCP00678.1 hypothetical protein [Rhodospirillaceae bacterium]
MTEHRYESRAVNADLLRAAIGLLCCLALLAAAELDAFATLVFAIPAALFAVFGLRTWCNRAIIVTLGPKHIAAGSRTITWDNLAGVTLSCFATRRDRDNGWMQLKLKSPQGNIALNSGLEGFDRVCCVAFEAARTYDIELTAASTRNFAALGLGEPGAAHPLSPNGDN